MCWEKVSPPHWERVYTIWWAGPEGGAFNLENYSLCSFFCLEEPEKRRLNVSKRKKWIQAATNIWYWTFLSITIFLFYLVLYGVIADDGMYIEKSSCLRQCSEWEGELSPAHIYSLFAQGDKVNFEFFSVWIEKNYQVNTGRIGKPWHRVNKIYFSFFTYVYCSLFSVILHCPQDCL